jgi:hypothetical protein
VREEFSKSAVPKTTEFISLEKDEEEEKEQKQL